MKKKILIDASYHDNIQVAVVAQNKLLDLDYASSAKKSIKGNIYLAKVTRVEPSLQAVFIDYGAEKNGFISFAEINPSYWNTPSKPSSPQRKPQQERSYDDEHDDQYDDQDSDEHHQHDEDDQDEDEFERMKIKTVERYKVQEVIKRNQILLVQAVKEERGNKGAAFTTYISLAGRYCVLMPNRNFKGGVSKKIESDEERRRLKDVMYNITSTEEYSNLIIRTVGQGKTENEIRQDYEYLACMWNTIREKTLTSNAPAFIYADDDIIKKSIRELYDDDTTEILIQGKQAYNEAKEIVQVLAHNNDIKLLEYKSDIPIFTKFKVDEQIIGLYSPTVHTESGAYIVINHTEALIAIDVNSGKSTGEKNIEETALRANLEAAKEIARQIRLRDLAGLIVIDFIDMVSTRNRKLVERTLRDHLMQDKSRVQVGYISRFGLLELSRQRLKPSFLEINTVVCTRCSGRGVIKSSEASSILILRTIEQELAKSKSRGIKVHAFPETALYILNHKRTDIRLIEEKYNATLCFYQDMHMNPEGFAIEVSNSAPDEADADEACENAPNKRAPSKKHTDANSNGSPQRRQRSSSKALTRES